MNDLIALCRPLLDDESEWEVLKNGVTGMSGTRAQQTGRLYRPDSSVVDYVMVPLPDGATLMTYVDVTDSTHGAALRTERCAGNADRLKSDHQLSVSVCRSRIFSASVKLETEMFGPLNQRQHEYMQAPREFGGAGRVVDDILGLAVIEAGAMTLDLSDVELSEVLFAAEEFAQRPAQKNKVTLRVECPREIGIVRADEKRIKQIMINLLSNALAFTSPGDAIVIGAARREASVELYVEDTGIGIAGIPVAMSSTVSRRWRLGAPSRCRPRPRWCVPSSSCMAAG